MVEPRTFCTACQFVCGAPLMCHPVPSAITVIFYFLCVERREALTAEATRARRPVPPRPSPCQTIGVFRPPSLLSAQPTPTLSRTLACKNFICSIRALLPRRLPSQSCGRGTSVVLTGACSFFFLKNGRQPFFVTLLVSPRPAWAAPPQRVRRWRSPTLIMRSGEARRAAGRLSPPTSPLLRVVKVLLLAAAAVPSWPPPFSRLSPLQPLQRASLPPPTPATLVPRLPRTLRTTASTPRAPAAGTRCP